MSTMSVNIMLITTVGHRPRVREKALRSDLHKFTATDRSMIQLVDTLRQFRSTKCLPKPDGSDSRSRERCTAA